MISYRPLWISIAERGWKKGDLHEKVGLSGATIAKMGKDEFVALEIIDRICEVMELPLEKVIRYEKGQRNSSQ